MLLFSTASIVTADDNYAKGISFYKKGDFKSSVKYLTAYTDKTPDPRAYYLLGYASYKLKDYSRSKKYFVDVFILDPNFKPAMIDMN